MFNPFMLSSMFKCYLNDLIILESVMLFRIDINSLFFVQYFVSVNVYLHFDSLTSDRLSSLFYAFAMC